MKIGISFDLRANMPSGPNVPDDAYEEFDSPQTIDAIADVLRGARHDVVLLGDGRELVEKVLRDPPDLVFNFAEGHGISRSREARVPALLEMLGIPYTGSDPFTMAVTLDKDCAKKLVAHAGLAVPASVAVEAGVPLSEVSLTHLRMPVVVKPAWEGSSKGIREKCLVENARELPALIESLRADYPQTVLIEEYIEGEELTVGLLGNGDPSVLGIMRVVPKTPTKHFIYSLETKRDYRNRVDYECPPKLSATILERVAAAAKLAFRTLGCRDVARIDFRVKGETPYFLEVNPLPGLNPIDSDLVLIAGMVNWSYDKLVMTIVNEALARTAACGLALK